MSRVGEHRISKFLTRFIFKKLIDLTGLGGVEEGKEHENKFVSRCVYGRFVSFYFSQCLDQNGRLMISTKQIFRLSLKYP